MPRNICQMAIKKRIMTAKVIGYMKPDIDPNTRLYVPFNEGVGDLAKDYSQYGNHATLTDVEWSPDGFNGAGKFNGSSSLGNCGNDASLNPTTAITIVAQIKRATTGTSQERIADNWALTPRTGYSFTINNNKLQVTLSKSVDMLTLHIGDNTCTTDRTDVAMVFDKQNITTYFNGNDDGSTACTSDIVTSSSDLYIGRYSPNAVQHFNGTIDNIIMFSIAKSVAQIAADCYEVVCN